MSHFGAHNAPTPFFVPTSAGQVRHSTAMDTLSHLSALSQWYSQELSHYTTGHLTPSLFGHSLSPMVKTSRQPPSFSIESLLGLNGQERNVQGSQLQRPVDRLTVNCSSSNFRRDRFYEQLAEERQHLVSPDSSTAKDIHCTANTSKGNNSPQPSSAPSRHLQPLTSPQRAPSMSPTMFGVPLAHSQHPGTLNIRKRSLSVSDESDRESPTLKVHKELELQNSSSSNLGHLGSASSSNGTKAKRIRTIFTPEQLEKLEAEFDRQQYLVGPPRQDLARHLCLHESQVKVWFQNRRIKYRKQHEEVTRLRLARMSRGQDPDAPSPVDHVLEAQGLSPKFANRNFDQSELSK
ncbi:Homeobox protein notochord [Halotydeus destructor]|nr:Homeobox protein notochord [Halotydeus destructor]